MKSVTIITLLLALALPAWAQLDFNPPINQPINFPDTPVGQSSQIALTAICRGGGPWTIRLAAQDPFAVNPAQLVLQAGQIGQFTLTFTAQQVGRVQGQMTGSIANDDAIQRVSTQLIGVGIEGGEPDIVVNPDVLDLFIFVDELGFIWNGTELDMVVSNAGEGDLDVSDITANVNWLTITPTDFTLEPGEEQAVTVSVPEQRWQAMAPDIFNAVISIISNDPDDGRLQVPVTFDRGFIPYYLVALGNEPPEAMHALLIEDAVIDGEELGIWDEVGVFTPRDDLAGANYSDGEWPIPILAWGEGQGFPGFHNGESFHFRMWDHSAEIEYEADAEFFEGPTVFETDAISTLVLMNAADRIEQIIPLRSGFNMVSLRVIPDDNYWVREEGPDIRRIFTAAVNNILLIKNDHGQFYSPRNNDFCNIPYWPLDRGMMARMSGDVELTIRGIPIPADEEVHLSHGWSFVAFYPDYALTMGRAFSALVEQGNLVLAKNVFGRFYSPRFGYGAGTLIQPGESILINVANDCSFRYPPPENAACTRLDNDVVFHFPQPQMTDVNMSVLIETINGVNIIPGAEIAAFTPGNLIAGAYRIEEGEPPFGMAIWGDSGFTGDTTEGFRDGEAIRFLYWDPVHEWELNVGFHIIEGGSAVYHTNGWLVLGITVGVNEDNLSQPARFRLAEPYPNPFNQQTIVEYELARDGNVELTLVDAVSGRLMRSLAKGWRAAGKRTLTLDASGLANGVYLLRLESNGLEETRKVVLIK